MMARWIRLRGGPGEITWVQQSRDVARAVIGRENCTANTNMAAACGIGFGRETDRIYAGIQIQFTKIANRPRP